MDFRENQRDLREILPHLAHLFSCLVAVCLIMESKALLFFVAFIFFSSLACCADDWYAGSLVLRSGKVLRGEISVRYEYDVLLFRLGHEDMVYPAHKIHSFTISDDDAETRRSFVSLQLSIGPATVFRFYEVVLDGELSVLRRQRVVWYSIHLDEDTYDYFVKSGRDVTSIQMFKRKVLPGMLREPENKLSSYVRKYRLSKHKLPDLIRIINQHNMLQVNRAPLARN
jgi:hypothetical protein